MIFTVDKDYRKDESLCYPSVYFSFCQRRIFHYLSFSAVCVSVCVCYWLTWLWVAEGVCVSSTHFKALSFTLGVLVSFFSPFLCKSSKLHKGHIFFFFHNFFCSAAKQFFWQTLTQTHVRTSATLKYTSSSYDDAST